MTSVHPLVVYFVYGTVEPLRCHTVISVHHRGALCAWPCTAPKVSNLTSVHLLVVYFVYGPVEPLAYSVLIPLTCGAPCVCSCRAKGSGPVCACSRPPHHGTRTTRQWRSTSAGLPAPWAGNTAWCTLADRTCLISIYLKY